MTGETPKPGRLEQPIVMTEETARKLIERLDRSVERSPLRSLRSSQVLSAFVGAAGFALFVVGVERAAEDIPVVSNAYGSIAVGALLLLVGGALLTRLGGRFRIARLLFDRLHHVVLPVKQCVDLQSVEQNTAHAASHANDDASVPTSVDENDHDAAAELPRSIVAIVIHAVPTRTTRPDNQNAASKTTASERPRSTAATGCG
jgi:hypothetical protein